ncbi:gp16 family protein [Oceanospirillum sp.]|uniref:gp16 family protein n=1 Tax=Oceanospirillum sp. TaxID=2021254 RepID=UPI003A95A85D
MTHLKKPSTTAKPTRQRLMAQIHIAKKQLGLDDDIYRACLVQATGKSSCKTMGVSELFQVLRHFEDKGFKARKSGKIRNSGAGKNAKPLSGGYSPQSRGRTIDKLRAIWIEMYKTGHINDGSEGALIHWVRNQTSRLNGGVGVSSLEWLQKDEQMAGQILERLKRWQQRMTQGKTHHVQTPSSHS